MKKILLALFLLFVGFSRAEARTFWVATNGTSSGCVDSATPPAASSMRSSIQAVIVNCSLVAGDTVNIRAGVYNEQIYIGLMGGPSINGAAGNPVTFFSYDGPRQAIIRKAGAPVENHVDIFNSSYITFDGLWIDGSQLVEPFGGGSFAGGLNLNASRFITFINGRIGNHRGQGVSVFQDLTSVSEGLLFSNSRFHHNGTRGDDETNGNHIHAFYACEGTTSNPNVVEFSEVDNNGGNGVSIGCQPTDAWIVRYNRIHSNGNCPTVGLECSNTPAYCSPFCGQNGAGIWMSDGTNQAYGNLIYRNETKTGPPNAPGILVTSTCRNCVVYNNTLWSNQSPGALPGSGADWPAGQQPQVRNNLASQNGTTYAGITGLGQIGPTDPGSGSGTLPTYSNNICGSGETGAGCTLFSSLIRLADPTNVDFRLCTAVGVPHASCTGQSVAVDAGVTLGSPWNGSFDGTLRPQGADYDIGAYEAGAITQQPTELILQLSCDTVDTSGSTITDTSGKGNHGTLQNGATSGVDAGKYNQACVFDGTNDQITVNDHNTLDVATGFTLMAWVKPTATSTNWKSVINKVDPTSVDWGKYYLYSSSSTAACGGPVAGFNEGTAANACHGTLVAATPNWTHLAVTYDPSTAPNVRLFRGGIEQSNTNSTATLSPTLGSLLIGASQFAGENFAGLIDEIRIYSGAIPPTSAEDGNCTNNLSVRSIIRDRDCPINAIPAATPTGMRVGSTGFKVGSAPLKVGP